MGRVLLALINVAAAVLEEVFNEKEHSGLAVRTVRSQKFIINSALNDAVLHEIIQSALRHSTASLLASKGWHPKEIQEWLRTLTFIRP